MRRPTRLDWGLTLAAVALGLLGYLIGDRINWSGGFGFDGRFYGELAKDFPSAVFGDGAVIPPGVGPYEGPRLEGVDSYYAYRILPSGIVWALTQVPGLSASTADIIFGFSLLNATMFGLATFCWCRSADLLGLGERSKLLGAIALIVNFAVLKTGSYYPVLTDQVALGLGALSLYLWLRGATLALAACVIVVSFAWPLHLLVGGLLLLFPAPTSPWRLADPVAAPRRLPGGFGLVIGGMAGLGVLVALTVFELQDYSQIAGTDRIGWLFPLSAAVTAAYVLAVVAFLLPRGGIRELIAILRSIHLRRLALAAAVAAVVLAGAALIARREGLSTGELFKDSLWTSTLDPGLFLVALASYFGPLVLIVLAAWPRVCAEAWRLGPGMVAALGIAMLGALTTQPRSITNLLPFLVLAGVLAARRVYPLTNAGLALFGLAALVVSRAWLPVGDIGFELEEFPAQLYFMTSGTWTSPGMWAAQLGGLALVGALFWLLARARPPAARTA